MRVYEWFLRRRVKGTHSYTRTCTYPILHTTVISQSSLQAVLKRLDIRDRGFETLRGWHGYRFV